MQHLASNSAPPAWMSSIGTAEDLTADNDAVHKCIQH